MYESTTRVRCLMKMNDGGRWTLGSEPWTVGSGREKGEGGIQN